MRLVLSVGVVLMMLSSASATINFVYHNYTALTSLMQQYAGACACSALRQLLLLHFLDILDYHESEACDK